MKILLVVYNEAIEDKVMESLKETGIEEYTRVPTVYGVGKSSGPHMGTHIWPSTNSMLIISCDDSTARSALDKIAALKEENRKLGIKAFLLNQEEQV